MTTLIEDLGGSEWLEFIGMKIIIIYSFGSLEVVKVSFRGNEYRFKRQRGKNVYSCNNRWSPYLKLLVKAELGIDLDNPFR